MPTPFTIPGLTTEQSHTICQILQQRLNSLIDLELTLKHVHWNVVGQNFIGIHELLDTNVAAVRLMVDETAERITTLGGQALGTLGRITHERAWEDYPLVRGTVSQHLRALNDIYSAIISNHMSAVKELDEYDLVTQDLLIKQTGDLQKQHWMLRAHLEDNHGKLHTETGDQLSS